MTFAEWLKTKIDLQNPIGHLAEDVFFDEKYKTVENNYEAWEEHLQNEGASYHAIDALDSAWKLYLHEVFDAG